MLLALGPVCVLHAWNRSDDDSTAHIRRKQADENRRAADCAALAKPRVDNKLTTVNGGSRDRRRIQHIHKFRDRVAQGFLICGRCGYEHSGVRGVQDGPPNGIEFRQHGRRRHEEIVAHFGDELRQISRERSIGNFNECEIDIPQSLGDE